MINFESQKSSVLDIIQKIGILLFTVPLYSLLLTTSSPSKLVYKKGELTMEVTEFNLLKNVASDSTEVLKKIEMLKQGLNARYIFTEDVFSVIQVRQGLDGMDTLVTINDLVNLQRYAVTSQGYVKDTLIIKNDRRQLDIEVISKRKLKKKRFGLNQTEFKCVTENNDTVLVVTTEDLELPQIGPSSVMNLVSTGTLLSIDLKLSDVYIRYEVTSFSPEISDLRYISKDFDLLFNLGDAFDLGRSGDNGQKVDHGDSVKRNEEYLSTGLNNDVLVQIAEEGFISYEYVEDIVLHKTNVDIPNVIKLLYSFPGEKSDYFSVKEGSEIIEDFKRWDIYSPSISTILDDTIYWNSINRRNKASALMYAALHDQYKTKEARKLIVENAKSIGFIKAVDKKINERFINNEISIDEWYGQFDMYSYLEQGESGSIDEVIEIVNYLFNEVFQDYSVEVDIKLRDNDIVIRSKNSNLVLPLETLYQIDYNSEYNKQESRYEYKDKITFDLTFYEVILNKIKQVAADNGLGSGGHIAKTSPIRPELMDIYSYQEFVQQFPSLEHHEERLYLMKRIDHVPDILISLNLSVPYDPDRLEPLVSNFGPVFYAKVSDMMKYVTTNNKANFLQILKSNAKIYQVDLESFATDSTYIMNKLMLGSELMAYMGKLKLKLKKTSRATPKSQYGKIFVEGRNSLSDAYYQIEQVFGEDVNINGFRYDEKSHKEYFTFKGKEYSIAPGERNIFEFITKRLKKSKSGRKLYRESSYLNSEDVYYYILPQHAKIFSKILDLPIS